MSDYPEHEKLKAIKDRSQAIGEFIEWLGDNDMAVCEFSGGNVDRWWPTGQPINKLLARYFEIDLDRLEDEKLAMLDAQRALNAKHAAESDRAHPWDTSVRTT